MGGGARVTANVGAEGVVECDRVLFAEIGSCAWLAARVAPEAYRTLGGSADQGEGDEKERDE